jgi:hypothetical protein
MPVISAPRGAGIRRVVVQSLGKWFATRPYLKKTHHKKRDAGVTQGVGPEFKPITAKQKQKQNKKLKTIFYLATPLPFIYLPAVLGLEPRALSIPGKCSKPLSHIPNH